MIEQSVIYGSKITMDKNPSYLILLVKFFLMTIHSFWNHRQFLFHLSLNIAQNYIKIRCNNAHGVGVRATRGGKLVFKLKKLNSVIM